MKWSSLFEKLKKIPAAVQSIVVGASVLFVELVSLMQEFDNFLLEFARIIMSSEMDTTSIDLDVLASTMAWLFYIFAFLFGILFFELIAYLVYRAMYGKRQIDGDRGYVMTVMRSVFIVNNVGVGIFNLFGFLNGNVELYVSATLGSVLFPVLFTLGFAHLLKHGNVYVDRVGTAYQTLFWIYFGIMGALSLWGLIQSVTNLTNVHAIVTSVLELVFTAGTGAALWFLARNRFMKTQKNPPDVFRNDDDGNEIFRGYGM